MTTLPDLSDMQRLPLRAIAAYALFCLRLIEPQVRKFFGNAFTEETLALFETIVTQASLESINSDDPLRLASTALTVNSKLPEDEHLPGLALSSALMIVFYVYNAAIFPRDARRRAVLAAKEAVRVGGRVLDCFDSAQEELTSKSIWNIYNKLLNHVEILDQTRIGEPIKLSLINGDT